MWNLYQIINQMRRKKAHKFKDRNEVILWIINNQLDQRNLTPEQRVLYIKRSDALKVIKEKAKERQGARTDIKPNIVEKLPQSRTSQKLAEIAGVSTNTIHRVETIITQGTPEDIKEVQTGKASISGKAKEIYTFIIPL